MHNREKGNFEYSDAVGEFAYSNSFNTQIESSLKGAYEEYDALKVLDLFERIRDDDIPIFDMDPKFCRPSDLIITHIPVPPSCIRPSVAVSQDTSNEDDLTIKLVEILTLNSNLKLALQDGAPPNKLLEDWLLLTYNVTQYFNSETPGLPFQLLGNKSIRSFSQRLKGKQGRFRLNLSAKRVDFTGRTVISPDPNCGIDEVIIPIYIAKNLTYPERVNQHNILKMKQLIKNGPEVHPGANYVEFPDGTKVSL
jgi:DNA-directed RNA polymerase III subunit RPC1